MADKPKTNKFSELIKVTLDMKEELHSKGVWKDKYYFVIETAQHAIERANKQELEFMYRNYIKTKDGEKL